MSKQILVSHSHKDSDKDIDYNISNHYPGLSQTMSPSVNIVTSKLSGIRNRESYCQYEQFPIRKHKFENLYIKNFEEEETEKLKYAVYLYNFYNKPRLEKKALENIEEEIRNSVYILGLKKGWDEENAKEISDSVYVASIKFLRKYARYIFDNFGIIIQTPEINPCRDGSVDLSWRTDKHRMLINIKESNGIPHAYYFMDSYKNAKQIKGNLPAEEFEEGLATWMKKLN